MSAEYQPTMSASVAAVTDGFGRLERAVRQLAVHCGTPLHADVERTAYELLWRGHLPDGAASSLANLRSARDLVASSPQLADPAFVERYLRSARRLRLLLLRLIAAPRPVRQATP